MRRTLLLVAGVALFTVVAIAQTHIPTRYAGSFPSAGNITSITGVFTGKSLTLKYTAVRGTRFIPTTANYSCASSAPNKTRCTGQFRTDNGQFAGRAGVLVTWSSGKPVNMHFGKKH